MIGTPLIQALDLDSDDKIRSPSSQRHNSQKKQFVTDSQGRRRLHGAFTGGFSAGYHNTVDSIGGFVPRTFVSHRGQKRGSNNEPSSSFAHKPEDYMDEEDQAEFGIAPKKIRVVGGYVNNEDRLKSSVIVNYKSLGEKILKNIYLATNHKPFKRKSSNSQTLLYPEKDNYHGVGYQPLKSREKLSDIRFGHDPLEALFRDGRKLKISGEAFGSGVLNDDDGLDDDLSIGDMYGHDNINNYEFPAGRSKKSKYNDSTTKSSSNFDDPYCIPNFSLSGTIRPNDEIPYKLPEIPHDWKVPRRDIEPFVNLEKQRSFLTNKFVTSSSHHSIDTPRTNIESMSGLLKLSDLKTKGAEIKSSAKEKTQETTTKKGNNLVAKKIVEWRPCSLLCKRFNVLNPFPDNLYFGVKPGALEDDDTTEKTEAQVDCDDATIVKTSIASMRFRSSIYDQNYSDHETLSSDESNDEPIDEDDYGAFNIDKHYVNQLDQDIDRHNHEDEECVVVSVQRKEPELIVLDCSSSSSS